MEYTNGEWKADVRVGVVAVYADNEITRSHLPCIPDRTVCIYYKNGKQELDKDGSFKQWDVRPEDVANAHLIAAAPDLYEACKATKEWLYGANIPYSEEKVNLKRIVVQAIAKAES